MSMGYMPKKVKHAKRQQRLRKKYKNFSCVTCSDRALCGRRFTYTPPFGALSTNHIFEFCPDWSPSLQAKKGQEAVTSHTDAKKRKSLKTILENIL